MHLNPFIPLVTFFPPGREHGSESFLRLAELVIHEGRVTAIHPARPTGRYALEGCCMADGHLTCVELFAGAGGASVGLHRAGFHSLLAVEWDKDAHATLQASGVSERAVCGDVRDPSLYDGLEGKVDLLWASPPCFPPGAMVVTAQGSRPIETLCAGDLILTHRGRYRPVLVKMERPFSGEIMEVRVGYGRGTILCTQEHPFFVRKFTGHRNHRDYFADPEWIEAENLHPKDLVLEPCVTEPVAYVAPTYHKWHSLGGRWGKPRRERRAYQSNVEVSKPEIADLLGLYISEGHLRGHDAERPGTCRREVVFSIALHEVEEVEARVRRAGFHPQINRKHSPGAARVTITSPDLWALCQEFGCGAENKKVPEWVFGMPVEWGKLLIQSYFRGDGSEKKQSRSSKTYWSASTVSLDLVRDMLRLITVCIGVVGGSTVLYEAHTRFIEERLVNVQRAFEIRFTPPGKSRPGKVSKAGAWLPVKGVNTSTYEGVVHNIEVAEDNSYTVNVVAVHNCQAWSTAGKRLGAFDERNGWPWTFDIIQRLKPKWVFCENVTGMKKHREGCPMRASDTTTDHDVFSLFSPEIPPEDRDGTMPSPEKGVGASAALGAPEECPGCYWNRVVLPWFANQFGYSAADTLVSANYGVPQRRERLIVMAGPVRAPWPTITHTLGTLNETKRTGAYWRKHGITAPPSRGSSYGEKDKVVRGEPWTTVRDAFSTLPPEPEGYDALWVTQNQLKRTLKFRGVTPERVSMDPDLPSDTVTCRRSGSKTNDALIFEDEGRLRYLTLAEVSALQSFPADHPWQGSKSAQYKQMGNAVPPPMAEALGRVVRGHL